MRVQSYLVFISEVSAGGGGIGLLGLFIPVSLSFGEQKTLKKVIK